MNNYIENPTQENRILNLLRTKGESGVPVWQLIAPRPQGLGIAQYNARIYGLREKGHVIENIKDGEHTKFVLRQDAESEHAVAGQRIML